MKSGIIQGFDPIDVVNFIHRKNKKFLAVTLQEIEETLGEDSSKFLEVRKVILDGFNAYTKSILRVLFGNDYE